MPKPAAFGTVLALLSLLPQSVTATSSPSQDGHRRMVELLQVVGEKTSEAHFYLSERAAREMRARFAALRPDAPDVIRWEAHLRLGEEEQRLGREQEAIDHFTEALRLLPAIAEDVAPEWVVRLYFRLGMAYLRRGETMNCALQHAPESCILPIRGSGIHVDPAPSRNAIPFFEKALELAKEGTDPYYTSRWLLNIAYMTVDGYPDEVPSRYRIPPEVFASEESFPLFPNVATGAGLASFTLSGGAVAEDFDLDGDLDLLVSTYAPFGQVRLFLNDGRGKFTDRTETAGLMGILGGLNMVEADYDDDGDMDVLMLRGAWLGRDGRHPNSLLRNNGDGTFRDLTFETGLGEAHHPTQTASWADFDNDGDLDLYVGNETNAGQESPAELFLNDGDRFRDVAAEAGVENRRFTKGVVWGDYDDDGWMDLYVSNLDAPNRLYRNRGDGTFEDRAPELGVTEPLKSFPTWFWDFDNDGRLDLYVSAYQALVMDITSHYLGGGYRGELAKLYRGNGEGGFEEVSRERNLVAPSAPMGANFGDLDNDGFLDFYLGTGYPPYFALMPNLMYLNREGRSFADVTTAGGFGHLQKGHAVVFADLDGDGDQDVFEQMGGALAGDRYTDVLYQNPGFGNHWLKVRLVGQRSNRSAIGARIAIEVIEGERRRRIYKRVNSGGSFGANPMVQTIGLGRADRIESLEVVWPASGLSQSFPNPPIDTSLVILETSSQPWPLGSGN